MSMLDCVGLRKNNYHRPGCHEGAVAECAGADDIVVNENKVGLSHTSGLNVVPVTCRELHILPGQ